jgi:predicted PurR-regulated permease PerM
MNALSQSLLFVVILISCALIGALLYHLAPVLTPFVIAAFLAYLIDPLVEKLTIGKWKVPRTVAVVGVFTLTFIVFLLVFLFLIPALHRQITALIANGPMMLAWVQQKVLPELVRFGLAPEDLGFDDVKAAVVSHSTQASAMAKWVSKTVLQSGTALLAWLMNILIIFVATFYLLRDWRKILQAIKTLLPPKVAPTVIKIAGQCDTVLSTFIRGQLSVMVALATYYGLALAIIGVHFSVLLGLVAGLLSIVPYLGGIIGLGAALLVAYLQFDAFWPVIAVLAVFGIGNILEGMILTPLLIGDKLGLHPVAVIFAVLAGGQLLGLVGVVLALPLTAILVVILREFLDDLQKPSRHARGSARG